MTTLAELVRELRKCCPKRNIKTIVDGHALPCDDPIHAFEERLIEWWHQPCCGCRLASDGYDPDIDPRCAEARRAAREGR